MKKIMTLALLVMTSLAVMAQEEVYKAEMDMLDAQGEAIVKQYKALMEQDPKSELPTTRAKITAFSQSWREPRSCWLVMRSAPQARCSAN